MKRREFIKLVGGVTAAWPLAARAQQAGKIHRVGFLGSATAAGSAKPVQSLRSGLREFGYVEGTNIAMEFRWAEGTYERLPLLAKLDLLVIQIDGLHIGNDLVLIAALGIDGEGHKHPLALIEGATENAAVVQPLIDNLIERGLDPKVCRLFIIDGAKALSKASVAPSVPTRRSSAARFIKPAM